MFVLRPWLRFYASLLATSASLSNGEQKTVESMIQYIENKGFTDEVFLLRRLASFRSNDHWLNASVEKENAFAATNYP
ncbi:MAG: hypothetical protein LC730_01055, partial [Acidobacteria bacterium]|nr:hypothetical protein [Acidobacteriota bacterium]